MINLAGTAVALGILVLAAGCSGPSAADSARRDARTVQCLSTQNRPQLVEASVALRITERGSASDRVRVDGRDLSLEEWRIRNPAGFNRACAAMVTAKAEGAGSDGGPGGTLTAVLTGVLSLTASILTAIVTGFVTVLVANAGRRKQLVSDLREQIRSFRDAGTAYVAGLGGEGPRVDARRLLASRDDLDVLLHRLTVEYPNWQAIQALRIDLKAAPLDARLEDRMLSTQDVGAAVSDLHRDIETRVDGCWWLAGALERPVRWWWHLRRRRVYHAGRSSIVASR